MIGCVRVRARELTGRHVEETFQSIFLVSSFLIFIVKNLRTKGITDLSDQEALGLGQGFSMSALLLSWAR